MESLEDVKSGTFLDISVPFIENSIKKAINAFENNGNLPNDGSDLKRVYFVGRTLALDIKDDFCTLKVITISYDDETFGLFDGDTRRRLLSIEALRDLRYLMDLVGIKHDDKPNL